MKRQKDTWAATEKTKRTSWMSKIRQEIKEETVKDLEPEIQRLLMLHKQEKRSLEDAFEEKQRMAKTEWISVSDQQMQQLKDKHSKDLELMVERERSSARLSLEQAKQVHQKQLDEREHYYQNALKDERERAHKALLDERKLYQDKLDMLKQESHEYSMKNKDQLDMIKRQADHAHVEEVKTLRLKWDMEKEQWQNLMIKKQEEEIKAFKRSITEKMQQQLNEQVDMLVTKTQDEIWDKLKQNNAQWNTQLLKEKKITEEWKEKHSAMQKAALKLDQDVKELTVQNTTLKQDKHDTLETYQQQVTEWKDKYFKSQSQYEQHSMVTQQNNSKEMNKLALERQKLEQDLTQKFKESDLVWQRKLSDLTMQLNDTNQTIIQQEDKHKKEIEKLITTSKLAIDKKDGMIKDLQERIRHTEAILAKTQSELLEWYCTKCR